MDRSVKLELDGNLYMITPQFQHEVYGSLKQAGFHRDKVKMEAKVATVQGLIVADLDEAGVKETRGLLTEHLKALKAGESE